MSVDPGALARLRVRLEEVLGVDDTAALLDPLAHVEWAKLTTTDDFDLLRTEVARQLAESQAGTERRIAGVEVRIAESQAGTERRIAGVERRIAESQAGTERRIAELQSQIRHDLLLVTGGQFFALIAAVTAVLGFG